MGIRDDLLKLSVEIGPRGACTAGEESAAGYIEERFERRGLETSMQEFSTIDTYSYLYVIYLSVAIVCACLSYWFPYYVAPIALLNAALFALDLETFPLVSRFLPKRSSGNVIGEIPAEDGKVGLVIVAHYDSARSAISFHPGMVKGLRLSLSMMIACVFAIAALDTVNFTVRLAGGRSNFWVWLAALIMAGYLAIPLFMMLHRERFLDYTPGANDNASGVAAMLALMDKVSEPESGIPGILFLATGAEEAGTVGMVRFLREYGERVKEALIVNLDNLGTGNLSYIDREGMLLPHCSSPVLLWLASRVVDKKQFPISRASYRLLTTDATPALARGYSAMSVMAFEDGLLPNWHWQTDTVDKIDMENIETARGFLWNLAKMLDLP